MNSNKNVPPRSVTIDIRLNASTPLFHTYTTIHDLVDDNAFCVYCRLLIHRHHQSLLILLLFLISVGSVPCKAKYTCKRTPEEGPHAALLNNNPTLLFVFRCFNNRIHMRQDTIRFITQRLICNDYCKFIVNGRTTIRIYVTNTE